MPVSGNFIQKCMIVFLVKLKLAKSERAKPQRMRGRTAVLLAIITNVTVIGNLLSWPPDSVEMCGRSGGGGGVCGGTTE